jgi:hypothetical protein
MKETPACSGDNFKLGPGPGTLAATGALGDRDRHVAECRRDSDRDRTRILFVTGRCDSDSCGPGRRVGRTPSQRLSACQSRRRVGGPSRSRLLSLEGPSLSIGLPAAAVGCDNLQCGQAGGPARAGPEVTTAGRCRPLRSSRADDPMIRHRTAARAPAGRHDSDRGPTRMTTECGPLTTADRKRPRAYLARPVSVVLYPARVHGPRLQTG